MTDTITILVDALRSELEQYGEMLALLDGQRQQIIARSADEVFQSIGQIKAQGGAIQKARAHREDCRASLGRLLSQTEEAAFAHLLPLLPGEFQPLIKALVDENNQLLVRVRQRVRQNHLLLSRSIELMQTLINTLFPAREMRVYNGQGAMNIRRPARRALYEAVG